MDHGHQRRATPINSRRLRVYTPQPSFSIFRPAAPSDSALAVPVSDGTNQGICATDNSAAAPVTWLLIDHESVPDDIEKGSGGTADGFAHGGRRVAAIASAYTSWLREVKFSFQSWGVLILDTGCLEMPDPCGVRPIRFLPEVLCNHHQLVLIRFCSTVSNSPVDFFIYSFPFPHFKEDVATVHKIPKVSPDILASQSFGLLRDKHNCDEYVVANLQMRNPKIGYVEVCVHRWWSSSEFWSSSHPESITLSTEIDMRKWQTDQVIPCSEHLLWVDLRQGIVFRLKNPLHRKDAKFDIIYLPHKISVRRPETFLSVGCCNGKLKFVILNISDVSVAVTIMTFNESSYKKRSGQHWYQTSRFSLKCTELWAAMKIMLMYSPAPLPSNWDVSENHMPCFPVLNSDKDILYLTMVRKDKKHAWLLQVDTESETSMESRALVGVIDYPGFCRHQRPPYACHCL